MNLQQFGRFFLRRLPSDDPIRELFTTRFHGGIIGQFSHTSSTALHMVIGPNQPRYSAHTYPTTCTKTLNVGEASPNVHVSRFLTASAPFAQ
jgi:hypothetical protein